MYLNFEANSNKVLTALSLLITFDVFKSDTYSFEDMKSQQLINNI